MPEVGAEFPGGAQDQLGGVPGGFVLGGVQDAGVGVGGEHDAGVTELVLDGLEIGAGSVGEAGRAVAEIVQPNGWQPGALDEAPGALGDRVRAQWCVPSARVNT